MGSLFTNLVQKVVISRKWTENGPMLDRERTDEVAEKSTRMSAVWAMMRVKLVNLVNFVMQILKWTKWTNWTKWTEQIFAESAESAKSAKPIFATFATFASANFVGKASCESTVRYREWSRIPSCCLRSAPVPPSFRLRLHPLRMVATLLLLLCLGVGEVWGALSSPYTCTFTAGMDMSGSNCTTGDVTWTISTTTGAGSPEIQFGNQNGQSCIKLGAGKKNYYSQMTLTTSAFTSYNVTSVVIYASSNNGGSKTFKVTQGATQIGTGNQSFSSTTWVSNITRNTNSGSGGDLSIEISSDATATFIHSIQVTYSTPSCTVKPTVGSTLSSVTSTVNSITATVPISAIGGCNITENGLVYSTTNSTPTVGGTGCTKVTVTACGSTAANKTVTISDLNCGTSYYVRGYATNNAGTSYTNVTTQSTSACPLYTVTLMDDKDTRTQVSYGAAVTLPSRAGCAGYTFAGWTKTWVAPQSSWTTTAPTIIPAGSYIPTANENIYPVYTKVEAGSGFSSYTKVTSAPDDWSGQYLLSTGTTTATGVDNSYHFSSISLTPGTTEYASYEFTLTKVGAVGYSIMAPSGDYVGWSSGTSFVITETEPTTSTTNYLWTPATNGYISNVNTTTRKIAYNGSSDFRPYSSPSSGATYLYKRNEGGSTTYYISVPGCCTALGTINGSVSWSNGTSATLTWDKLSNVDGTTPYTITCKQTGGSSAGSVGSVDLTGSKATCTITGLTAGNSYDFKIAVSAASGYCDKDSTMTSTAPKITATTDANLVEATYAEGSGPSTNASYFTFSGVGLTGDITVTAPTNFQVSKTSSSSGFGSSVTVSPSTGSITNQKIWIRLASGLTNASSPYGGNVALSGGSAASVNVAVTGSVSSACTAPTVATPTLASIVSGTITVSCASITVDDNCDLSEYGFVWKASSDPAIGDNKNAIATSYADNFSKALSISFTTGNTYKIKAFGTNVAGTTLSSSLTVTPQKVTFNSNGGSDVADKYVNKDTKVTAPSDPTKSGYTFGGWYREAGCTNAWTFGTDVVSKDTTLYAKWTANQYDVTLSPNSGSGSDQTVSATYGSNMPLVVKTAGTAIVIPTRTGYDFGGYYNTSAASGGTQYYTYTGNPKALGSARNWDVANSTTTLYARWTPHQHKVSVSAVDHGTITATPAGGSAISEGNYNATVDYDKTVTLGWTKDNHYNTLVWTVHRDGDESTTVTVTGSGNGATFTMPDYDVVVKATISEDPYTLVTFKNNGTAISGYEDVKYYSGRPTAPTMTDGHSTGDACDEDSEVFYGWTADSWEYKISKSAASAKTIYKKGDNLPTVAASGDVVVYNAVWAEEVEGDDYTLVNDLSKIKAGDAYFAAYANYSGLRWYGVTDASTFTAPVTVTDNVLTTTGLMKFTLVATGNTNEWYIKNGSKYLSGSGNANDLSLADDACAWLMDNINASSQVQIRREISSSYHYIKAGVGSTTSGKFRTYTSSGQNVSVFQTGSDLGNFMTHCCEDLITLGTPSISNGTITYDWDSPIPTCNSGKTVTATITPSTGYKVTGLTFSGGGVSYDAPDFPITEATNVTLTFAQNTDAATLSASATTAAIPVSSLSLRAQQTDQSDKVGDDLTMTCYPKEGQTGGNDPLNHTLKVKFEEVLPANALDKTYDWSVRVKAKDDADWTDVDFTGNALNTNTIINSYNKSTGNLQIKATEGTAEIKITAHDGSGVTAKVTITVANVAMTGVSVDPTSMTVYAGQKKAVAVTFTPLNATNKAYSAGSSYSYVNIQNKAAATFNIEGKTSVTSATVNETVTVTTTDGSFTATVDVTIKPLPLVHFVDNVHNESFDDVVATTDGTTVTFAKTTPTHVDLDEPGSGNSCEKTHLHLIGWIRGDWPAYVAYMNGTGSAPSNSDLTGATGYFYAPGAEITLTDAMHGMTFYAVWAKVE